MKIDKIIDELKKYDKSICTMYDGVEPKYISDLENKIGYNLPLDFKEFLKKCNGFEVLSDKVYGIHPKNKAMDLYSNYIWEREESNNPIWEFLLPISPDGSGSHYCLDLKSCKDDKCKVVYWQHDYKYSEDDPPDIDNESFSEFCWELLQDIKEEINYDGTDK